MCRRVMTRHSLAAMLCASGLALGLAPMAHADPPGGDPANPYPGADLLLTSYDRVDPADYFIPGTYGVFFSSPTGLSCGIWTRGSFGCGGFLPGEPPGVDHIGWNNGDTIVHTDLTVTGAFPNVQPMRQLPPHSYINWNETTCATTGDSSTYCKRGGYKFFIGPKGTEFSPSWAPGTW